MVVCFEKIARSYNHGIGTNDANLHLLALYIDIKHSELQIEPYDNFEIDRSLDSTIFQRETQYSPPSWLELVDKMYDNFTTAPHYQDKRVQKEI